MSTMDTSDHGVQNIQAYFSTFDIFKDILDNKTTGLGNIFLVEFLQFIKENPKLAIPMLLWIDTFHDFTQLRTVKGTNETEDEIASINNVLDFYLKEKQGVWGKDNKKEWKIVPQTKYTKLLIENTNYSISKCYRDSFFDYTNGFELYLDINDEQSKFVFFPFHEDVQHTLLKECYKFDEESSNNNVQPSKKKSNIQTKINTNKSNKFEHRCARILYQMSLFIYDTKGFEPNLLYSYIVYNFFESKDKTYNYKSIAYKLSKSVITTIDSEKNGVEYYAKDLDMKKTSKRFNNSKLIILPSSLFDQNKLNSSNNPKNFANISKTIVPFVGVNNFEYAFNNKLNSINIMEQCNLTVSTNFYDNKETIIYNSCKAQNKDKFIDIINKEAEYNNNFKPCFPQSILEKQNSINIKNLAKYIDTNSGEFKSYKYGFINNKYDFLDKLYNFIDCIKPHKNSVGYNKDFSEYKSPFIYKEGFSVKEISLRIMCEIVTKIKNSSNWEYTYSLLPAYDFDKYMSLKRVGDYAQILQCKQLGIPLVTDDNMQILLSIASCSSIIWTPSDRMLYYNGESDCFIDFNNSKCVNISPTQILKRNTDNYKEDIDKLLMIKKENSLKNKKEILKQDKTIETQQNEQTIKENKEKEEQKRLIDCSIKKYIDSSIDKKAKTKAINMIADLKGMGKVPIWYSLDITKDIDKILNNTELTCGDNTEKLDVLYKTETEEKLSNQSQSNRKRTQDKQKIVTSGILKGRRKYKKRSGPGKKYKRYTTTRKSKSRKNK